MAQTPALLHQDDGGVIDYTPGSDVIAGQVVEIGSIPMVAESAIPANTKGALTNTGIFKVPKTSDTFTAGDAVHWNSSGTPVTGDASSGAADGATGNLMGVAVLDAATGDTYVYVLLTAAKRTTSIGGAVTASSITAEDASLDINGIAAAQGGAVLITGGTSSTGGNAGGALTFTGGTGGAAGAGGAVSLVGGVPASGNAAGGAGTFSGGAGSGTGAGGAVTTRGGASGAGATGNGGAWSGGGGAALSTNGTGGAATLSGGVATGTGTGGAVTIIGGASAGASGTAGGVTIDPGAAAGGTAGTVTICGTNGSLKVGSNATDRVAIKGIYMTPSDVVVAVPTIADAECDTVAVDVSGAFSMQPAVGDAVIAIPQEALPTDCLLGGASVTGTDEITVNFTTKEGGGGVTGANKNFKFLVIDLT